MRADPGFRGFQLAFKHSDRASPSAIVTGQAGEARPGREWGNFPAPRVPPRLVPRIVCHLLLVIVVTLSESVGWRRPAPPNGLHRVRQRGARCAAMPGIYRDVYPNNATVDRNVSLTRSLLHLAPIAHSARDNLARVCARFPRTISTQSAHRLARLLRVSTTE
jgi:hypothetical protein